MKKPQEYLPSGELYPREVLELNERIKDKMSEMDYEEVKDLVDNVYKIAYVDGFADALYYKDLI